MKEKQARNEIKKGGRKEIKEKEQWVEILEKTKGSQMKRDKELKWRNESGKNMKKVDRKDIKEKRK